ncbi:hypothetical protein COLO4_35726 [Corchorus olitorius]|uniref:SWIM-type domain-containing protein n=1 Tax=Corchorus olitorius TaxID=93759 RepID=A0A1R3GDP2_9ROSI|nr:hypothetical protein COLO4_35726 [Corchorus olitorius]
MQSRWREFDLNAALSNNEDEYVVDGEDDDAQSAEGINLFGYNALKEEERVPHPFFNEVDAASLRREDVVGKFVFDTVVEATQFYITYATHMGFSVRKETNHYNKRTRELSGKLYVCWKEGSRKDKWFKLPNRIHNPKPETRTCCLARMHICKKCDKWIVTQFNVEHNHDMVPENQKFLIKTNRSHCDERVGFRYISSHELLYQPSWWSAARGIYTDRFVQFNGNVFKNKDTGTIFEFMRCVDKAKLSMRMLELEADFYSRNRRPVTRFSHLRELEEYAGFVYTERAFARFKREVEREKGLSSRLVQSLNRVRTYFVMRYRRPERVLRVEVHDDEGMIKCSCRKFETEGIPCRHIINIMKVEDMERIPDAMVLRRWRIDCGKNNATVKPFTIDVEDTKIFRQVSLRVLCNEICEDANESDLAFEEAKESLEKLHEALLMMKMASMVTPAIVMEHKAPPTCGHCRGVGHTSRSCKKSKLAPSNVNVNLNDDEVIDADESDEELVRQHFPKYEAYLDEVSSSNDDIDLNF